MTLIGCELPSLVIQDDSAFRFLAGLIELEAVWNGSLYRWTGYATKIHPNDDLPPQMHDLMQSNPWPFYVTIQLGTDLSDFSGLLDDVSTAPLVADALTESEIESLSQDGKEASEYAKRAFRRLRGFQ